MILYNGIVYSEGNLNSALVIEKNKIVYIGDDAEALRYAENKSDEECIDLRGRLVLPGFIDSHAHGGYFTAMKTKKIDLSNSRSADEYLGIIKKFIDENPEIDFYKGVGWQSPVFGEEGPDKRLLDNICSKKPIVIKATEGHSIWANSKAIELAGVTDKTPDPKGGIIVKNADGSVRGAFLDEAQNFIEKIMPDDSIEVYKEAILEYQSLMASYGYTATSEMMMVKNSNLYKAYQELAEEKKLLIKTLLSHWILPSDQEAILESLKDNRKVFENKIIDGYYAKIFVDGVVERATAWLKEPYSNADGYYGEALWDDKKLFDTCLALDKLGYDLHFHVIGDKAVSQMLDALEMIRKLNGEKTRRPVAAHVQLLDKADLVRMKDMNVSVSANPYWFYRDKEYTDKNELPKLGERIKHQYPMKTLIDAGLIVSTGSDFAITPEPDPIQAIKFGMERVAKGAAIDDMETVLNPQERVSLDTMLKSVTINGAYTMNIDEYTGSLKKGKMADLVVLDKNLFNLSTLEYQDISVDMTISEGQIIYEKADMEHGL